MSDDAPARGPIATVVVPAHDEATVIDRCLRTLLADAEPGELDVIVSCNACTDDTADRAARHPGVRVISIDTASKQAALQAADDVAATFPRIYLDADIQLSTDATRAMAEALTGPPVGAATETSSGTSIEAAAPRMHYDLRRTPWSLKTYLRLVERLPVYADGYVGSGVYGLSERGRARFGAWPRDLPDDTLVHRIVPAANRATTAGRFVVTPSSNLRQHLRRAVRIQRLNRALERRSDLPIEPASQGSTVRFLREELRSPRSWPAIALFAAGAVATRVSSWWLDRRGAPAQWLRDDATR